jgi:hypothetical protein
MPVNPEVGSTGQRSAVAGINLPNMFPLYAAHRIQYRGEYEMLLLHIFGRILDAGSEMLDPRCWILY